MAMAVLGPLAVVGHPSHLMLYIKELPQPPATELPQGSALQPLSLCAPHETYGAQSSL